VNREFATVKVLGRSKTVRLSVALAAAGLVLTPAIALGQAKKRPSAVSLSIDPISGFTPASSDPKLAAALAARGTSLTPASYNLGVAVGWRRFAVSADVAKSKEADPALGGRESAALGVSYSLGKRLTTRVAVGAERGDGKALPILRKDDNVSVDVGGAYALTRNIAVTGGVRYRIDHDRVSALKDDRRDSQAVYVGTAFKF
jgi:hypothetical protein